jgi:hypothetical protein
VSGATIVRLAWAAWWLTLVFEIGTVGFGLANVAGDPRAGGDVLDLLVATSAAILVFQSMVTVGVLIARRDAGNAVGWIFFPEGASANL